MADLVPPEDIEQIVGAPRDATVHYGRAVSVERRVYVLHSRECVDSTPDLRDCLFSIALDRGIESPAAWRSWRRLLDRPMVLHIRYDGLLVPDLVAHATDLDAPRAAPGG